MTHPSGSWHTSILTLYPDMFPGPLGASLSGRALEERIWTCKAINIRDFAEDKHRTVDGTPSGGGAGMVLKADVVASAIDAVTQPDDDRPRILMSPRGTPLTQSRVRQLAAGNGAIILCGRFEGVDQRVIDARNLEEISIGDYILSGGEIAALTLMDACVRLLPGVMGTQASGDDESFENNLLEYPQYTRPATWEGHDIPSVLTSGDHGAVEKWRREQSLKITRERRPDLASKD